MLCLCAFLPESNGASFSFFGVFISKSHQILSKLNYATSKPIVKLYTFYFFKGCNNILHAEKEKLSKYLWENRTHCNWASCHPNCRYAGIYHSSGCGCFKFQLDRCPGQHHTSYPKFNGWNFYLERRMTFLNTFLPFLSSLISFIFAYFVFNRYATKKGKHLLLWGIGMIFYGILIVVVAFRPGIPAAR